LLRFARLSRISDCHNDPVTREEWAEFDRSIAASVARGEAAIARQEAAVARQDEIRARQDEIRVKHDAAVQRQQEATARIEVATADIEESRRRTDEILAELREGRDERRAILEGLMRMIDRLPPPKGAG
jgi:chromosome segregation ATPase